MKAHTNATVLGLCGLLLLSASCGSGDDSGASSSNAADSGSSTDASVSDDTAGTDTAGATGADATAAKDAGPTLLEAPEGNVYEHDPVTDKGKTIKVKLTKPITADGALKSNWVEIRNCLNKDGGPKIMYGGFEAGTFCIEDKVARPGKDGHYTHIVPPTDTKDPNDAFAEVQMYHHVNTMHDYFKGTHGLTDVDFPLHALVNVQMKLSALAAAATGQPPGWSGMANAAYMPPEAFKQLPLPPRDTGAIVFFQWQGTDFAYDASVIYHEYTHAMIGTTRLQGAGLSLYGLDMWAGAMNEGFADYFAASMTDYPVIGAYALQAVQAYLKRDVTEKRTCPQDITSEIHADGRIIGAAMWAVREKLGKIKADSIILSALQSFTKATNLDGAMKLIVAEAGKQGSKADVEAILKDHGLIGCVPAKEWKEWNYLGSKDLLPYTIQGKQGQAAGQLKDGMPGSVQFWFEPPAGTHAVELSYQVGGGGMGGFGGAPMVNLALAHKAPVTMNIFGGYVNADIKVSPGKSPSNPKVQTVTLDNPCIAVGGRFYAMFLNQGAGTGQLQWLGIKYKKKGDKLINAHDCKK